MRNKLVVAAIAAALASLIAATTPGENRLIREVRHELIMLPYYGVFDNLAYRVEGGKVTLEGHVTRPTLKSFAEKVVAGIEGVEQGRGSSTLTTSVRLKKKSLRQGRLSSRCSMQWARS